MPDDPKPARKITLVGDTLVIPFATRPAGGWAALTGTVRPATPGEAAEYFADRAKPGADETAVRSAFYARLIRAWNVDAKVSAEAVAALPFPVWAQLDDIVLGYVEDPAGNSAGTSSS